MHGTQANTVGGNNMDKTLQEKLQERINEIARMKEEELIRKEEFLKTHASKMHRFETEQKKLNKELNTL